MSFVDLEPPVAAPAPVGAPTPAIDPAVDVGSLVRVLSRHKRAIIVGCAIGLAVAVAAAFLLPPRFRAKAVIMAPQQQQSALSVVAGQLSALQGLASRDLGLKNPADLYVGIARSRTVADAIIERFGLQARYGTPTLTATRAALEKRTTIEANKNTLIDIAVEDEDAKTAAALANAYVGELHSQNSKLAITDASQRRLFFENQLDSEKRQLSAAESALAGMQRRTGLVQLTSQVDAVVRSLAQVRAEIAMRQVNLERLKVAATAANPEVVRTERELAALRTELSRLESAQRRPGDLMIAPASISDSGLEYVRAVREVKYHEALFEAFAKQYEAARVDEARQAPVIQVVDIAVPPDQKSWPPRLLLILGGAVLGSLAGALWILLKHPARIGEAVRG